MVDQPLKIAEIIRTIPLGLGLVRRSMFDNLAELVNIKMSPTT